jgi:hypothetical protein
MFDHEGFVMSWWEWLLLACAVIFTPWMLWDFLHYNCCFACRLSRNVMHDRYPDCRVSGSSHRATEPGRAVVAVFYIPPPPVIKPEPYWLVAVDRGGVVQQLAPEAEPLYRILGRKRLVGVVNPGFYNRLF